MSIKFVVKLAACATLVSSISLRCASQQTQPPANSESTSSPSSPAASTPSAASQSTQPTGTDQDKSSSSPQTTSAQQPADQSKDKNKQTTNGKGKVAGTSNDRLFYTLPNFLSMQGGKQLPPLTAGQKFKVVALSTFDYVQYPWWGILSAIDQASNAEPAYGQGWVAYAKRYGTTAADSTVENFMVGAVYSSILHQDPRFYVSTEGGFTRRTGYAISRIFVTKSDSGRTQFNYSEIFGSATAATISTYSYHPKSTYLSTPTNPHKFIPSDRTLANTASVWATQVGLDTITIGLKEFWPDIQRKLSHKHDGPVGTAPPPTPKP